MRGSARWQLLGSTRLVALCFSLAIAGCRNGASESDAATESAAPVEVPVTALDFAPELGIVLDSMTRVESGVYIQDVRRGTGATAETGRTVVLEYRAWLPNGTLYEQRPNAEGFSAAELVLGDGEPRGLHEGIAGMKTGGTRKIVVPPDLSYGLVGRPAAVPANSAVVFEVRLRAVR